MNENRIPCLIHLSTLFCLRIHDAYNLSGFDDTALINWEISQYELIYEFIGSKVIKRFLSFVNKERIVSLFLVIYAEDFGI